MHIFSYINDFNGNFNELKALNYIAADINKLIIILNSILYSYITAGYINGKTYIWDMAISDKLIYILAYRLLFEGIRINNAENDIGVKFTA